MSDSISKFVLDRDEALRSLDLKKVRAFSTKYGNDHFHISDEVLEIAVHKARTTNLNLNEDEREFSRKWLTSHGYHSLG